MKNRDVFALLQGLSNITHCYRYQPKQSLHYAERMLETGRDNEALTAVLKGIAVDLLAERRAERWIDRDILCSQNRAMEAFQKADESWFEDVANAYASQCPQCGNVLDDESELDGENNEHNGESWNYRCSGCRHWFDEPAEEAREIFEWWAVTDWLAGQLAEHGEPVFSGPSDTSIWGRTSTGQAILLDGTIQEIAHGILQDSDAETLFDLCKAEVNR